MAYEKGAFFSVISYSQNGGRIMIWNIGFTLFSSNAIARFFLGLNLVKSIQLFGFLEKENGKTTCSTLLWT